MSHKPETQLILASTSVYRQRLLERLALPFVCIAPGVAETMLPDEAPDAMAARLSAAKALAVSRHHPHALVIGSDQVASLEDRCLGKPGDAATARAQLQACSSKALKFFTGVALAKGNTVVDQQCISTDVQFRCLTAAEIADYVDREQPLDCAGSFRWEGLGIALFEHLRSDDPTALEGLPLITTTAMLRRNGLKVI